MGKIIIQRDIAGVLTQTCSVRVNKYDRKETRIGSLDCQLFCPNNHGTQDDLPSIGTSEFVECEKATEATNKPGEQIKIFL